METVDSARRRRLRLQLTNNVPPTASITSGMMIQGTMVENCFSANDNVQ